MELLTICLCSVSEARERFGDPEMRGAEGLVEFNDLAMRFRELDELLTQPATIFLAHDTEGFLFGMVEGDERFGEVLAFSENGQVGWGGVNHPIYHATLAGLHGEQGCTGAIEDGRLSHNGDTCPFHEAGANERRPTDG